MQQKRFIAGAVCPSCRALDKIVLEKQTTFQKINCVRCGYTQTQPLSAALPPKMMRVEQE